MKNCRIGQIVVGKNLTGLYSVWNGCKGKIIDINTDIDSILIEFEKKM